MLLATLEKGVGLRAAGCRPPRSHGHAATACARQTKGGLFQRSAFRGGSPGVTAAAGRGVCGEGAARGAGGAGRKEEGRPRTR